MGNFEKAPFTSVGELIAAAAAERATLYGRGKDEQVTSFLNELYGRALRDLASIDNETFENILGVAEQNDQNGNGVFAKFEAMILEPIKRRYPDAKLEKPAYSKTWQVVYTAAGKKMQRSVREALDER